MTGGGVDVPDEGSGVDIPGTVRWGKATSLLFPDVLGVNEDPFG